MVSRGYSGWKASASCASLYASFSIERPLTKKFADSEVEKNGGSRRQQMKTACPQWSSPSRLIISVLCAQFIPKLKPFTRVAISDVEMSSRHTTTRSSCGKILFASVNLHVAALFLSVFSLTKAHDCHRNLETVWQSDVGSSPVVSSSLVADFNGDNVKDVLVASFNGQVSVVDGRSGHNLPGWPLTLPGKLLFAAPLLVCERLSNPKTLDFSVKQITKSQRWISTWICTLTLFNWIICYLDIACFLFLVDIFLLIYSWNFSQTVHTIVAWLLQGHPSST